MIEFKSVSDLQKLPTCHPAFPVMKNLVEQLIEAYDTPERAYSADAYGYCVLLEDGDLDGRELPGIGHNFLEVLWEGAFKKDGFYVAILLWNDDAGMTVTIPDEPWIPSEVRQLLDELVSY